MADEEGHLGVEHKGGNDERTKAVGVVVEAVAAAGGGTVAGEHTEAAGKAGAHSLGGSFGVLGGHVEVEEYGEARRNWEAVAGCCMDMMVVPRRESRPVRRVRPGRPGQHGHCESAQQLWVAGIGRTGAGKLVEERHLEAEEEDRNRRLPLRRWSKVHRDTVNTMKLTQLLPLVRVKPGYVNDRSSGLARRNPVLRALFRNCRRDSKSWGELLISVGEWKIKCLVWT